MSLRVVLEGIWVLSETVKKEKNLPQIYWIPKLHKTTYKARFIAGSSSCTTTRLSKLITEWLKLIRTHCTAYCKTIRVRSGVLKCIWIINNSLDVIRALEEKQLSLIHVSTWDFSTLHTSLPHAQLKSNSMIFWKEFLILRKELHCYQ